jgi:hypothetical protein
MFTKPLPLLSSGPVARGFLSASTPAAVQHGEFLSRVRVGAVQKPCVGYFFSKDKGAITLSLGQVFVNPVFRFSSCSVSTTATNSHN